jgi:DNA integrity scanning protein DisA with diadenylate cyclase activity
MLPNFPDLSLTLEEKFHLASLESALEKALKEAVIEICLQIQTQLFVHRNVAKTLMEEFKKCHNPNP